MEVKQNSYKAWWLAARPKTLTGAMIPVMLGGSMAYYDSCFTDNGIGSTLLHIMLWICCLLFACFMQIAANFINDVFDFKKGTDREDRLGPERACAQGWITPKAMIYGIFVVIILACISGLTTVVLSYDSLPYKGLEFIALGLICIIFAFLYTTKLSYLGWGDVLVLVFFGLVPVCGTYYLQAHNISLNAIILSLISGIAIDALLAINNYRDRDQDKISGKNTLVVRFGEKFGSYHYLSIGIITSLLILVLTILLDKPLVLLAMVIYLFGLHIRTWKSMMKINHGRELNKILGETSRNMFLMALTLTILLIISH